MELLNFAVLQESEYFCLSFMEYYKGHKESGRILKELWSAWRTIAQNEYFR
jgi:hypothetical protein